MFVSLVLLPYLRVLCLLTSGSPSSPCRVQNPCLSVCLTISPSVHGTGFSSASHGQGSNSGFFSFTCLRDHLNPCNDFSFVIFSFDPPMKGEEVTIWSSFPLKHMKQGPVGLPPWPLIPEISPWTVQKARFAHTLLLYFLLFLGFPPFCPPRAQEPPLWAPKLASLPH